MRALAVEQPIFDAKLERLGFSLMRDKSERYQPDIVKFGNMRATTGMFRLAQHVRSTGGAGLWNALQSSDEIKHFDGLNTIAGPVQMRVSGKNVADGSASAMLEEGPARAALGLELAGRDCPAMDAGREAWLAWGKKFDWAMHGEEQSPCVNAMENLFELVDFVERAGAVSEKTKDNHSAALTAGPSDMEPLTWLLQWVERAVGAGRFAWNDGEKAPWLGSMEIARAAGRLIQDRWEEMMELGGGNFYALARASAQGDASRLSAVATKAKDLWLSRSMALKGPPQAAPNGGPSTREFKPLSPDSLGQAASLFGKKCRFGAPKEAKEMVSEIFMASHPSYSAFSARDAMVEQEVQKIREEAEAAMPRGAEDRESPSKTQNKERQRHKQIASQRAKNARAELVENRVQAERWGIAAREMAMEFELFGDAMEPWTPLGRYVDLCLGAGKGRARLLHPTERIQEGVFMAEAAASAVEGRSGARMLALAQECMRVIALSSDFNQLNRVMQRAELFLASGGGDAEKLLRAPALRL